MCISEEQVIYVKREMAERGFYSRDFANLPGNMVNGSRELLLALGWLMCKENIFQCFMVRCTSPLDEDTQAQYKVHQELEEDFKMWTNLSCHMCHQGWKKS